MNRWPKASARKKLKSNAEKIEKKILDIEALLETLQEAVAHYQSAFDSIGASSGFRNPPLMPFDPQQN